ncbi:MAG TPA: ATP-binding protein, partial [Methylophilaceae bacterium]|nr:ATP-binding protein [Methylophilaceae bacterium]
SDIVALSRESLKNNGRIELPHSAREILLNDQYDKTYFSILDENGKLLAGDGRLLVPSIDARDEDGIVFYDDVINGEEVRAIATEFQSIINGQQHNWLVLVGETRNKREGLARDILTGFVVPQALIILLAAGLVVFGVRRGLGSLEELRAALARRSHNDMRPLDTPDVPEEVQPLMRELNSLLMRLEAVFESQKHFISDAAHQLRTPLAGLTAQIDLARSQANPPQTAHALEQMKAVSDRLNHAVNQLLSLARNEAGTGRAPEMAPLDLDEFARDVTLEWVERAVEHGVDLGFEGDGRHTVVLADAGRLAEALDNLIDNALKYCPRGSVVTVRVNGRTLSVEDNGPGIPIEERERIFERFHRLLGHRKDGNGLGLAIVKEIVEMHGATIAAGQPPSGRGALFLINFPASDETAGD